MRILSGFEKSILARGGANFYLAHSQILACHGPEYNLSNKQHYDGGRGVKNCSKFHDVIYV